MNPIKDAFQKVKDDMNSLKEELDFIKKELAELKNNSKDNSKNDFNSQNFNQEKKDFEGSNLENFQTDTSTDNSTHRHKNQTDSLDTSTEKYSLEASKSQNLGFSTGNQGVPTDRQTDRQTNRQTDFEGVEQDFGKKDYQKNESKEYPEITHSEKHNQENFSKDFHKNKQKNQRDQTINNAAEILDSLDSLKKEIRLKFKRLTEQEFLIFSTLYQIDQELGYASYKDISERLNLTESSIRDYIGRLINKGIPVEKNKINNKNIQLKISENLKKIATLPTIIQLRDI